MPALPLHEAGKYVAGAYAVFLVLILVYVAIMATRLARIQREVAHILSELDRGDRAAELPALESPHEEPVP